MTAARTIAPFIVFSVGLLRAGCSLTRYVLCNRQVGASAEFHWYMLLTAACRQRHGGHNGRHHNHALNAHGLLSWVFSGNRIACYRGATLRSRTQPLTQGFCTPVDAELPRDTGAHRPAEDAEHRDCVGPTDATGPRSAARTHQRG